MIEVFSGHSGIFIGVLCLLAGAVLTFNLGRLFSSNTDQESRQFIDQMKDGYYRSSLDGTMLTANSALLRLSGFTDKKQMLIHLSEQKDQWYLDPHRGKEFLALLKDFGRVDDFRSEVYQHGSNERIWISEHARLVCDGSGQPKYYEGTVCEITDTVRKLELENSYRKFSENVPGAMFQARHTPEGKFTIPFCSSGFFELFGELGDEILWDDAKCLWRLVLPENGIAFSDAVKKSQMSCAPLNHEFPIQRRDGTNAWLDIKATPELEADGSTLWHGFLMEVTERKKTEKHIHDLAYFDPLTGLANRRLLSDRLQRSLHSSHVNRTHGSVIFVDVDNFKNLNDTRGHGAGDQFLEEVAKRLKNCVGDHGSVCRFGGDEFVILLDSVKSSEEEAASPCK